MNLIIYPKVNIFLKILGFDGKFHQIQSRFVQVCGALYDEMQISKSSHFTLKGDFGCAIEENLIYKAKCAMGDFLFRRGQNTKGLDTLKVEVQKSIPKGSGLGGGSANAGAFLRAANSFLELGLESDDLNQIAQKVGSDVSFFVSGFESANVWGRGEHIELFTEPPLSCEIYTPFLSCSSSRVYQSYADSIRSQRHTYSIFLKEWFSLTSQELLQTNHSREGMNDLFVSATFAYPELKDIASELGDEWYFSGSGSSFFRLKV